MGQSTLTERLRSITNLDKVTQACTAESGNLYVGGGFVRDALLNRPHCGDLDLFLEADASLYPRLQQKVREFTALLSPLKSEITLCQNFRMRMLQGDFTINTCGYSLQENKIVAEPQALADIQSKTIRATSPLFLITSPRAFVRAFRLAEELSGSIDSDTLGLIKKYHGLTHLPSPYGFSKVLVELIRYLSLPSLERTLAPALESGLFNSIFPMLQVGDSLKESGDALIKFDVLLKVYPEIVRKDFFSPQGAVRLALLLFRSAGNFLATDSSLTGDFNTRTYRELVLMRLIRPYGEQIDNTPQTQEFFRSITQYAIELDRGALSNSKTVTGLALKLLAESRTAVRDNDTATLLSTLPSI